MAHAPPPHRPDPDQPDRMPDRRYDAFGVNPTLTDPVSLTRALIARYSVTPRDDGVMGLCQQWGEALGFSAQSFDFGEVRNLVLTRRVGLDAGAANRATPRARHLGFAGHVDVVPAGDEDAWSLPPFAADLAQGRIVGRGAVDMKGAIACFFAAIARLDATEGERIALSLLLTGDEEGPALDGTQAVLPELDRLGLLADHYIVGEPTSAHRIGDVIKIGRRGSLNAHICVTGRQGHVAYPELAINPLSVLMDLLAHWRARELDLGAPDFDPSNLEVTSIDCPNPTHNLIPRQAEARLNIRFNIAHRGADLRQWLEESCAAFALKSGAQIEAVIKVTGEPFRTPPNAFTDLLARSVKTVTGGPSEFSTSGGTSDARFIARFRPVAELGLRNHCAHQVDEWVGVEELEQLTRIYGAILRDYAELS